MKVQRTPAVVLSIALLALPVLPGCSDDEPPPTPPPRPQRTAAAAPPAPAPDVAEPELPEYNYEPTGKRDPFKPPIDVERPPEDDRGDPSRRGDDEPRGPLEELDVLEWKLVAVVQTPGRPRALVEGPAGRGYIVEEGTRIGRWKGEVAVIDEDRLLVVERFVDSRGGVRTQEIPLYLRVPEDDGGPQGGLAP